MKKWLHKNIVYVIAIVILVTLFIQAYWNIKNYEANKITVNNEVMAALNNSVDSYYTNLAKSDIKSTIVHEELPENQKIPKNIEMLIDSLIKTAPETTGVISQDLKTGTIINVTSIDSNGKSLPPEVAQMLKIKNRPGSVTATGTIESKDTDSLQGLNNLATKIIISLSLDELDFKSLNKYLKDELKRKDLNFNYALSHIKEDSKPVNYGNVKNPEYQLSVDSKSAYLPSGTYIKMYYPNINLIALKEGLAGILLSFLFTIAIITSLIYLLRIIKQQKQIVLSKNDFISNISHELKTPIATSLSALEAIQHFNAADDKDKTDKYMGIASQQLKKLNVMVEKILDTASLDSDRIALQKEMTDIVPIISNVVEKHLLNTQKEISFIPETKILLANIDAFHFENVVNNIIENAIKYGGNTITVKVAPAHKHAIITFSDDGKPIDKSQRSKIFDKFYRISTQNRHDVKGYGIGLYYSKSIIEKHNGKLTLEDDDKYTIFKITIPYA